MSTAVFEGALQGARDTYRNLPEWIRPALRLLGSAVTDRSLFLFDESEDPFDGADWIDAYGAVHYPRGAEALRLAPASIGGSPVMIGRETDAECWPAWCVDYFAQSPVGDTNREIVVGGFMPEAPALVFCDVARRAGLQSLRDVAHRLVRQVVANNYFTQTLEPGSTLSREACTQQTAEALAAISLVQANLPPDGAFAFVTP